MSVFHACMGSSVSFERLPRGCLCDNWKPSLLSRRIVNWPTFSRRVTVRWSRGWVKNQVSTNQNSRNSWYQIVRRTISQAFLSLAMSFLTFLSFRSLLITSLHVFLGCPLGEQLLTLKIVQLLDQAGLIEFT